MPPKYHIENVEQAIEDAIAALKRGPHRPDQIADLADAIEAYDLGTYGIAMVLARAASHPMRPTPDFRNLEDLETPLGELEMRFASLRQHRFGAPLSGIAGAPSRRG